MERRVYRYETVGSIQYGADGAGPAGSSGGYRGAGRAADGGPGPHGPQLPVPGGAGAVRICAAAEQPGGRPAHSGAGGHGRCAVPSAAAAVCPAASNGPTIWCCRAGRSAAFWRRPCRGRRAALWVVVGIGINVCQRREDFLPELWETAASLSMIAGAEIDRAALETAFLEELEALRRELPQETAERRQEYGAACLNLGRRVPGAAPRRRAGGTGRCP